MSVEAFFLHAMPLDGVVLREYSHTHAAYVRVIECDRIALDRDWRSLLQAAGMTITDFRSGIDDLVQGFTVSGCVDVSLIRGERGTYMTLAGCYCCFERAVETMNAILRTIDRPLTISPSRHSDFAYDPTTFVQQIEKRYHALLTEFRRDHPNRLIVPPHAFWSRVHEARATCTPEKYAIRRACLPWQRQFAGTLIDLTIVPFLLLMLELTGAVSVTGQYAAVFRRLIMAMLILSLIRALLTHILTGIKLVYDRLTHSFVCAKMQYLQSTLGYRTLLCRIRGRISWSDHRCQEILMAANTGKATYHSAYLHQMEIGHHYTVTYAKHSRIVISICAADGTEMLDFTR